MITVYVVLDGFDLGVGALYLRLARTNAEREEASGAIGPIWNGNEVWLIAGGGVLFLAFPVAYAAAFSGLYFGLILVLWLLVGRALALGAFVVLVLAQHRGEWTRAFAASSLFIAGLLTTLAAGIYPYVLPAREGEPHGLTAQGAAAGSHALKTGLVWYPLGMTLAVVYFVFAYRMFFRTATVRSTSEAMDQPSSG